MKVKATPEDGAAKYFWRLLLIPVTIKLDDKNIWVSNIGVAIETTMGEPSHKDIVTGVTGDAIPLVIRRSTRLLGLLLDPTAVVLDHEEIIASSIGVAIKAA